MRPSPRNPSFAIPGNGSSAGRSDGSPKRALNGLGFVRNHRKQRPSAAIRNAAALFPVLNRVQRKSEPGGKFSLAELHARAHLSDIVRLRNMNPHARNANSVHSFKAGAGPGLLGGIRGREMAVLPGQDLEYQKIRGMKARHGDMV